MLKIGLTGGIGAGKSLVASIFEVLGIPVYLADPQAKILMYRNKELKQQIKQLLGVKAYHRNGRLNRKFVAGKVFKDKHLLSSLNDLVHPAVRNDFVQWANNQSSKYVLEESALIFEIKAQSFFDKTIVVSAKDELRIKRVIKRDALSREEVLQRMSNQWPQKKKESMADYVIKNNGEESLIKQILKIHYSLINLKKQ